MAKMLTILPVSIITIATIILVLGLVMPECSSPYRFSSVKEARTWGHIKVAEIIDEIGDTNGTYRLVSCIVSGVSQPFDFDLKCRGHNIKWSQPASTNTWFVVTVFENRARNQFAVIRKRTKGD